MRKYVLLLSGLLFGLLLTPRANFAQCVPDTSIIDGDGIYPDTLAPVVGCQPFEQQVTFVFPRDTTASIGGTPVTFPFQFFRIDSISGLPDGVDWACDLSPDCEYLVHPDSANVDTVGCISLFGTPSIPATYPLQVWVTAQVIIFGTPGDNPISFDFPLTVQPCEFTGSCYTLNLSSNCEPASLSFTNEVPSNGNPGYSYQWTVSGTNGFLYQSTDENPLTLPLVDADTYTVNYDAVIDTIGYILNGAIIESVNCTDPLGGAGDLYWKLFDPNGTELVNTIATPILNGADSVPVNTGIGGILLEPGQYEFQVWDDDSNIPLDNDDGCATNMGNAGASVFFTSPPAQPGDLSVTVNGLTVTFTFDKPVTTVACSDTFVVGALPEEPSILPAEDSVYAPFLGLCEGDTLFLRTSSSDSLQWFLDGGVLVGENDSVLAVFEEGIYTVEAISGDQFCRQASMPVEVEILSVQAPSIAFDGNMTLQVASPDPTFLYEWYEVSNGLVGTGSVIQINSSGSYYAVAVNPATGCSSDSSVVLDIVVSSIRDPWEELASVRLFPNPSNGQTTLQMDFVNGPERVSVHLWDLMGRQVWKQDYPPQGTQVELSMDLSYLPTGWYQVQILAGGQQKWVKLQLQTE